MKPAKNIIMLTLFFAVFTALIVGFIISGLIKDLEFVGIQKSIQSQLETQYGGGNQLELGLAFKSTGVHATELGAEVFTNLQKVDPNVKGMNIISDEQKIVYSDRADLINTIFSSPDRLEKSLRGESSYVIDNNIVTADVVRSNELGSVLLLYYPFQINGKTHAAQIIYDYTKEESRADQINLLLWIAITISIGLLTMAISSVSKMRFHLLETHNKDLESKVRRRTKQLENAQKNLQQQVRSRTKELKEASDKTTKALLQLQEVHKSSESQNVDLVRKTIELTELKGKLEDKNFDLEEAKSELEDKNAELEKANLKVSKLLQARNEFLRHASHDLRTPLTPITTLLPLIKEDTKNKDTLHHISIIENNVKYVSSLVEQFLTFVKAQTALDTYSIKTERLDTTIEEVLKNHEAVLRSNKIKLKKSMSTNLPQVKMDKTKIIEVMQNIISNAIKFMPKGGTLTVTVKRNKDQIEVRIADTGVGMRKETISKVFDEFYKADSSRHYQGSGLGLAICKEMIKVHKGMIWAESKGLRKGSTFIFTLPVA